MPHIHDKIDFTVAIFVVQQAQVLLVHHRALGKWLPLGGHIELDEYPEQAARAKRAKKADWTLNCLAHGRPQQNRERGRCSRPGSSISTGSAPRMSISA